MLIKHGSYHPYNKWIVGVENAILDCYCSTKMHTAAGTNFRASAEEKTDFISGMTYNIY